MSNEKRRQKKLERKKQQRKQRHTTLAKNKSRGLAEQMADASRYPLLHTRYQETIFDVGIGHAMISRQLPDGQIAVAMFLLDVFCLGVKDALGFVVTPGIYRERFVDSEQGQGMVNAPPEEVRKLVEDSVAFGTYCGLQPCADYRRVKPIFGDIDATKCDRYFEFGVEEGIPNFIPGPYDSPQRIRQVLAELDERFGTDGFHFTVVNKSLDDTLLIE